MLADLYSRVITFPKGMLDFDDHFVFNRAPNDHFCLSIASRAMLITDDEVHEYGRNVAETQNARAARQDLVGGRHHIGFYDVACCALKTVQSEFYEIIITWAPGSTKAHYHIEMVPKDIAIAAPDPALVEELTPKQVEKRRSADRRKTTTLIADLFVGPTLAPEEDLSPDHKQYVENKIPKRDESVRLTAESSHLGEKLRIPAETNISNSD